MAKQNKDICVVCNHRSTPQPSLMAYITCWAKITSASSCDVFMSSLMVRSPLWLCSGQSSADVTISLLSEPMKWLSRKSAMREINWTLVFVTFNTMSFDGRGDPTKSYLELSQPFQSGVRLDTIFYVSVKHKIHISIAQKFANVVCNSFEKISYFPSFEPVDCWVKHCTSVNEQCLCVLCVETSTF